MHLLKQVSLVGRINKINKFIARLMKEIVLKTQITVSGMRKRKSIKNIHILKYKNGTLHKLEPKSFTTYMKWKNFLERQTTKFFQ